MPLSPEQFHTLYDAVAQPVLLVQDGTVAACSAAACPLVAPGTALDALLPDGEALPPLFTQTPCRMQLELSGRTASATTQPLDGGVLVFLAADDVPMVGPVALERAAYAISAPLSSLTAAAASLAPMLSDAEDPALQRTFSEVYRACFRLLRISGDLTEMSRAWQGALHLNREKTDLSDFLADLCMNVSTLCRQAGCPLDYDLPAAPVFAWIDRRQLERAVLALLSNAIKFSASGSQVRLTLTRMQKRACIRVADSGEGMDAQTLAGAFRRCGESPVPGDARIGAGFSLPLVQAFAQAHGGSLLLQSKENQGTDVCLMLPLGKPDDPSLIKSPFVHVDRTGGFSPELVGLCDVLPVETFDPRGF